MKYLSFKFALRLLPLDILILHRYTFMSSRTCFIIIYFKCKACINATIFAMSSEIPALPSSR